MFKGEGTMSDKRFPMKTLLTLFCVGAMSLGCGGIIDLISGEDEQAAADVIPPPPPPPAAVASKTGLPTPSWVFCMGAFKTKAKAESEAAKYRKKGLVDAGVLWIPDYASLSEAQMYLVHAGTHPFSDKAGAKAQLKKVQKVRKKAYGLKLDTTGPRVSL